MAGWQLVKSVRGQTSRSERCAQECDQPRAVDKHSEPGECIHGAVGWRAANRSGSLRADRGDPVTTGPTESVKIRRRKYKVDVQVHYRDVRPLAGASVQVTLLRRALPAAAAQWPAITISAAWKKAVEQLMTGATPAGWSLLDGWTVADSGTRVRSLSSDVDARTPRTVTFDVTFSANTANQDFVLLAVVHSTPDPVTAAGLTGATLQDLVLNNHQIAIRAVRVIRDAV